MRHTQTCGRTHQELRVQATPHHHRYVLFTIITTAQSTETYQEMISYICPLFCRKTKTCTECVFECVGFVRIVCLSRKCVVSKCGERLDFWVRSKWEGKREQKFRAHLHQASASTQSRSCDDACNIALIENNGVTPKLVATSFWSDSICFHWFRWQLCRENHRSVRWLCVDAGAWCKQAYCQRGRIRWAQQYAFWN